MTETTDEWNTAYSKAVNSPDVGQIHAAINAVYNEVGYVQKTGEMKGNARDDGRATIQYKFAGEKDFIEAIRPSMVKHGIYLHIHRVREVLHEVVPTKFGQSNRVTLIATVRFTHTDGSFIESEATGEGMDTGDKASNKAMTGALKYALRQTFCIETGTDPDDTPSSDQQRDTTPRQNTPARAPQRPTEQVAAAPEQHSAPPTNGNSWGQLTELMRENKIGKAWVEPIIGGFSADILTTWLAAEEGRSVQEIIATAVTKKGS